MRKRHSVATDWATEISVWATGFSVWATENPVAQTVERESLTLRRVGEGAFRASYARVFKRFNQ